MTLEGRVVLVNATGIRSGAENVLADVATELVGSVTEVVLVSPPGAVMSAMPEGVRHVAIRGLVLVGGDGFARIRGMLNLVASWASAARVLRSVCGPEDTVVVNSLFALPVLMLAFPRGRRGLTTWLVHDTVVSRKQRVAVAMGAQRLDRAVAVSEATAASVRPLVREVIVRVNGVRIPSSPVLSASARDRRVVGILALLTPWKGQDVLLEAIARVSDAELEIAGAAGKGDAGYERALRSRAELPDLTGRVRFLGHVDKAEVLSRWSVVVSASVLPEAGPLGVLECMAAGVPVIATDHGGAAEYLRDGAGVLVPPGDSTALSVAVERVLGDPSLGETLAAVARARVEQRHDLAVTLPALVDALTSR